MTVNVVALISTTCEKRGRVPTPLLVSSRLFGYNPKKSLPVYVKSAIQPNGYQRSDDDDGYCRRCQPKNFLTDLSIRYESAPFH